MSWYEDFEELDDLLETIIDVWSSDRWSAHADEVREVLDIIDDFAKYILQTSEHLVWNEDVKQSHRFRLGKKSPIAFLKNAGIYDLAREKIQVDLAWRYGATTKEMAERVLLLSDVVIPASPNERVSRYLRRIARCYVVNFVAESVILCRSVLEAALDERIDEAGIPAPEDESGKSALWVKVRTAERLRWITPDEARLATTVRIRGNRAVHDDPEATKDALDTIRMTMQVLSSLYADG